VARLPSDQLLYAALLSGGHFLIALKIGTWEIGCCGNLVVCCTDVLLA